VLVVLQQARGRLVRCAHRHLHSRSHKELHHVEILLLNYHSALDHVPQRHKMHAIGGIGIDQNIRLSGREWQESIFGNERADSGILGNELADSGIDPAECYSHDLNEKAVGMVVLAQEVTIQQSFQSMRPSAFKLLDPGKLQSNPRVTLPPKTTIFDRVGSCCGIIIAITRSPSACDSGRY
jgi:hypothetical protein